MEPATADAELVRITDRLAAASGWDLADALSAAGITRPSLDVPELRVTVRQARVFLRCALASTARPDLGLLIGAGQTLTTWGVLGLAMVAADDVEQAVSVGLRYRSLAGPLAELHTHDDQGALVLTTEPLPGLEDVSRFVVEEMFASIAGMLSLGLGLPPGVPAPIEAEFAFPPPDDSAVLLDLFGAAATYESAASRLVIPADVLRTPLPTADRFCHRKMRRLLDDEVAARHEIHGFVAQVERSISLHLDEAPTMPAIASRFHVSERTLRRRLAEAGTTFQALVDALRRDRAHEMLSTGATYTEVARVCGLSDERSLRRALARWK
ncbi:AraC family transcriptional regulator [Phytoactinopolyspora limicola]|uniref:AraC family transcriptional regulator n=1 Tax=Phytoactinopolyspora limicola TaxID=2715536 RepID=UPI001407CFF6|nr:AraC family transcriptional regulator [Phytoactinopolyspora limicola]